MSFSSHVAGISEEQEKRKNFQKQTSEQDWVTETTSKKWNQRIKMKKDGEKGEISRRESEAEACGGLWAGAAAASA